MPEEIEKDRRPYITVANTMPDHPKIVGLSPAAKWTIVEIWCYCSLYSTDGLVVAAKWKTFGTAAIRSQLMAAGVIEPGCDGNVICHDYDKHQRTSDEIAAYRVERAETGALGAHTRHHVMRRRRSPDCPYCVADG